MYNNVKQDNMKFYSYNNVSSPVKVMFKLITTLFRYNIIIITHVLLLYENSERYFPSEQSPVTG